MWIWELHRTAGGSLRRIAAKAKAHRIDTVLVKGADGSQRWWQLNARLVDFFHRRDIRVCGWQYVYGHRPITEGRVAARIIKATGIDCFVIDAEIEYEVARNRVRSARQYLRAIRSRVGRDYLLGFSSFPWASLHRRLPYGVFLGPGGAQVNLPQVYWRAIGVTPTHALARTYRDNARYGRPIVPVGQTYMRPGSGQMHRFENLSHHRYDARGVSWWDWQETHGRGWHALRTPHLPRRVALRARRARAAQQPHAAAAQRAAVLLVAAVRRLAGEA